MRVFSLQCGLGHGFEGWFASEDAFVEQGKRGLLECPLCARRDVQRLPSAPRLNLSTTRDVVCPPTDEKTGIEALWMRAVQHVLEQTEDVGDRFADEARRIHYGEAFQRGIRGRTSREEAEALHDEGIEVFALPISVRPPGLEH